MTTTKTKHTTGPWKLINTGDSLSLLGNGENKLVAEFPTLAKEMGVAYTPDEEDAANLKLIAAAPELLEALQGLLNVVNVRIDDPRIAQFDAARAAITKATTV